MEGAPPIANPSRVSHGLQFPPGANYGLIFLPSRHTGRANGGTGVAKPERIESGLAGWLRGGSAFGTWQPMVVRDMEEPRGGGGGGQGRASVDALWRCHRAAGLATRGSYSVRIQ